ncbi:hypothetical protein [Sporosarcina ureilytica]|nr:hypothetical protein [Sporosarcina ureilytica]
MSRRHYGVFVVYPEIDELIDESFCSNADTVIITFSSGLLSESWYDEVY